MKKIVIKTLILSLTILVTNNLTAAESKPCWKAPQWQLKAILHNANPYCVAFTKNGKNLLTKESSHNRGDRTTEWDLATLTPIKEERHSMEYGTLFDEKGNKYDPLWDWQRQTMAEAAKKTLSNYISKDEVIETATFSPDGKQLVTVTVIKDKVFHDHPISRTPKIWQYVPEIQQHKPPFESKTTE